MTDNEPDYSQCTLSDLYDVQRRIDRAAYPERARRVDELIERKRAEVYDAESIPPPRMRFEMPFILTVIMGIGAGAAAWSPWALICGLLNKGNFTVSGQPVEGLVFVKSYWWLLLAPGLMGAPIAYGLRRERIWAREAIVLAWLVIIVGLFAYNITANTLSTAIRSVFNPTIALVVSSGYLYGKESVRRYYAALESQSPSASSGA